jgi:hypothetical protein
VHFFQNEFIEIDSVDLKAKGASQLNAAQQSVHLTLGSLRKSQAVSYALSFFQLDGFAVPSPSAGNANRWAVPCKATIFFGHVTIKR